MYKSRPCSYFCSQSAEQQPANSATLPSFSTNSATLPKLKMNGIVFSGVCLLFLFTLSTADLCTDFTDTTSDIFRCNAELVQRSNSACEGDCRTTLEQYADDCLMGAAAQTYKDSIETLCSSSPLPVPTNPASNPTCTAFGDSSSQLFMCNVDLVQRSQMACSADCRSAFDNYVDECLQGAAADTFRSPITTLCGEGTPAPSTNDTPAATTNNTSTDSAGAMGPALFSTASALFFAVYAAFF